MKQKSCLFCDDFMYQFNINHLNSQELLMLQGTSLYAEVYSSLKYPKSRQFLPPLLRIVCITRINKTHAGLELGFVSKGV